MNKFEYKNLTPFKWFVLENFPFIEADFDALTEWQLFCKLGKEMNKIINSENTLGTQMENVTNAFIELQNYVNNYFDNLDVQDEIDNKLNEMASDGTLEKIINEELFTTLNSKYLHSLVTYKTINNMIEDETLENGQTVYVKGKLAEGDGFSAYYNIVNQGIENQEYTIKLNNNLYAVLQNELEENYYNEITYNKERYNNTDCYYINIPLNDKNNNLINISVEKAGINPIRNNTNTPMEHAQINNTTFTSNAALAVEIDGQYVDGIVISNGTILRDYSMAGKISDEYKYIGIKEDRTIKSYQANAVTAQAMIDDGVKNAVLCFGTCVENGKIVENFPHDTKPDVSLFLGIKENKDIIILACDGRNSSNFGLTYQTGGQLLIDKGCIEVYCLDSGGSSSINLRGNKLNMSIDNDGTTDRKISYLFDIKKTITNKQNANIYSNIGNFIHNKNMQYMRLINKREPLILRTRLNITQQTIKPNLSTNGDKLINLVLSAPSTSHITVENGTIKINIPEQYLSPFPYQIKLHGHITIHNTTGANTSHFVNIMENENVISTYRNTIGNDDYSTFTIDELLFNLTSIHEYSILINANNINDTVVTGGNLWLEYIPKNESYL